MVGVLARLVDMDGGGGRVDSFSRGVALNGPAYPEWEGLEEGGGFTAGTNFPGDIGFFSSFYYPPLV